MVKASLKSLGIFIALLCGVFITLQIPSVKKELFIWLIEKALDEPSHKVIIDQVEGILPFSVVIPNLEIHDEKGPWLSLNQIDIKVSWLSFKVDFITLKNLTVKHSPHFQTPSSQDPLDFLPVIIGQQYVQKLHIETIDLAPELLGQSFHGKLTWLLDPHEGQNIDLQTSLGTINTTINTRKTNQVEFKITHLNYQDYLITGLINIDYSDKKKLDTDLDLLISHPTLLKPLPLQCQIISNQLQSFNIKGKADLKDLDVVNNTIGEFLNYTLTVELSGNDIEIKDININDSKYHSLEGKTHINTETNILKGTFKYDFSGSEVLGHQAIEAVLTGTLNKPNLKLISHNPQANAEIEWNQLTQQLNFNFSANKIKGEKGKLTSLSGKGHIDSNLTGQASLQIGEGKIKDISFGKSTFTINLNQGNGSYRFNMIPNPKGLSITFDSKGQLQLEKDNPSFKGNLNLKTFVARSKKKSGELAKKDIEIHNTFAWSMRQLEWQSVYQPSSPTPLKMKGTLELDQGKISKTTHCHIATKGQFNLSSLMPWITNGDRISGKILLDLSLSGPLERPNLQGILEVKKGFYEISEFGTCIGNIDLQLQAKGTRLHIQNLRADDGTKRTAPNGQLTGQGFIDLTNLMIPLLDISLNINDFQIAASDSFFSRAGGKITLKGAGEQAKIEGDITLNPTGLLLEEVNPTPRIPTIKLLNPPPEKKKQTNKQTDLKIFPILLKLKVAKRFMIQGFGLESLWEGEIDVVNYISDTQLVGGIRLVKGKLELLGKVMSISKGEIKFDKAFVNDPQLSIVAVREVDGITINLIVDGRASNPRFTFMSIPVMAEEEILSRLLFGKELSKISMGQSLQLAAAAATMNGQKGLNIMDKVRASFGLDILEIKENTSDTDERTSQALSIGKEFGKVRISIDQSINGAGSKATISTALTPRLNLDVDIGGSQSSGIGLSWIKRY